MAVCINESDDFVEELGVDDHLDLFAFLKISGLDVGLHVVKEAGENGLDEGVEAPFGDEVEAVFFHGFFNNLGQHKQIPIVYSFKVVNQYFNHFQSIVLADVFLDVHVDALVD